MFGITQIVKGYSIHTYLLYCYAIFISEDIMRQRGGVTFGTPCTTSGGLAIGHVFGSPSKATDACVQ